MNDFREYSEFYHYGVKGMHWGVRRYQNPDGTLTAEGKRRKNLSDEQAYVEYRKESNKKEGRYEAAKALSFLGSSIGGTAASIALLPNSPILLAGAAAGIGGGCIANIVLDKIKNKKIDVIKKSYGEKRIKRAEKIVNDMALSKTIDKSISYTLAGSNIEQATFAGLQERERRKIAESLMTGELSLKDIQKALKSK